MLLLGALLLASPALAGPLRLEVDARRATRQTLHARLEVPVQPGPLTLVYPTWMPGEHGPTGPVFNLTGLRFTAAGRPLAWTRDPVDLATFRLAVPDGATSLQAELDFLIPAGGKFSGGRAASDRLLVLSWNEVLLYPAGRPASEVQVAASLRLPDGWRHATALPERPAAADGALVFETVSLVRLIDSPVQAGLHQEILPVDERHDIAVAADSAASGRMKPEWVAGLARMAAQAGSLLGERPYAHYRWLLTLSDEVEHFGLEHHESSDNRVDEDMLGSERGRRRVGGLLAHEYTHAWNGKHRRPADLATPDYQQPMRSGLLWVYEGLTEHVGFLLAGRSGMWTPEEWRENLAEVAASMEHRAGRRWRPLGDTAVSARQLFTAPEEGTSWRRSSDYYDEAALIWLEADLKIRQATAGGRSLDDFCRRFEGVPGAAYTPVTYTRDDVVAALTAVAPLDWKGFLARRVDEVAEHAPLGGIEEGGWKLVYSALPNVFGQDRDERSHGLDESFSIGAGFKEDGSVEDVVPGMAAANAGLAPGMKVLGVNGRVYDKDRLRPAIAATAAGQPLELLVSSHEYLHTLRLAYDGGLRYPHLVRDESKPDLLAQVVAPRP